MGVLNCFYITKQRFHCLWWDKKWTKHFYSLSVAGYILMKNAKKKFIWSQKWCSTKLSDLASFTHTPDSDLFSKTHSPGMSYFKPLQESIWHFQSDTHFDTHVPMTRQYSWDTKVVDSIQWDRVKLGVLRIWLEFFSHVSLGALENFSNNWRIESQENRTKMIHNMIFS